MTLTHGLHYEIPAAQYHADPCATPSLSSTLARVLLEKSPAHAARVHPQIGEARDEETPAMTTGSILHALMAESDDVVIGEFADFRTAAARIWRDEVTALGKIPVLSTSDTFRNAESMAAAIRQRAAIGISPSPFGPRSAPEVTAIWKEDGCECRARFDLLTMDDHTADIWDWKTTNDITDRGIERSIARYRYDIEAAFYLRGLEKVLPKYRGRMSFVFVFVESSAPFAVRRVVLQPSYLAAAQKRVSEAIATWAQCLAADDFPLPSPETYAVELPAWLDDLDDEISTS